MSLQCKSQHDAKKRERGEEGQIDRYSYTRAGRLESAVIWSR